MFNVKELFRQNVAKASRTNKRTTKIFIKCKAPLLIPTYSMTTHKSHGQTFSKIIIDLVMSPDLTELTSVYVPLSRVKRLDDLLIICPFEFAPIQVKPSKAQMEELKRLDLIAQKTRKHSPLSVYRPLEYAIYYILFQVLLHSVEMKLPIACCHYKISIFLY